MAGGVALVYQKRGDYQNHNTKFITRRKKNKLETEYSFLEVETSVKPKNAKMLFWKPQKKNERYITNQT